MMENNQYNAWCINTCSYTKNNNLRHCMNVIFMLYFILSTEQAQSFTAD